MSVITTQENDTVIPESEAMQIADKLKEYIATYVLFVDLQHFVVQKIITVALYYSIYVGDLTKGPCIYKILERCLIR